VGDKILVAFASSAGSTEEIATVISGVLLSSGQRVDQCRMSQVRVITTYRAVVMGTAIRRGKPLPDAMRFVGEHRAALRHLRIACFSAGVYMREDTPENRKRTEAFLAPLLVEINQPVALGCFAGKIDRNLLSRFWRWLAPRDASGQAVHGDWRDWDKIQSWAQDLAEKLIAQG
jgi:menaquinone-dependent protoporphyrinogen oxidase